MNEAISARPWGELFNRATLGWPQRFLHQFAKAGYGEMFGMHPMITAFWNGAFHRTL